MDGMQIISRVDKPSECCAGNLDGNILRDFHLLLSVEHTLVQLSGTTVFSKFDENEGFTSFITPIWEILRQPPTLWDKFSPWTFSKADHGALWQTDAFLVFGKTTNELEQQLEETPHKPRRLISLWMKKSACF